MYETDLKFYFNSLFFRHQWSSVGVGMNQETQRSHPLEWEFGQYILSFDGYGF